jgi:integral membrane protein (TIGR01906 family)
VRALTAALAGLGLALLVVGIALIPLLHPTFTKLLAQRYSETALSGLTETQVLYYAEQVREFVADADLNTLPATVAGRPGFDQAAVSHLRDVRRVLSGAQTFTGVLAAVMVVWLGVEIVRKRYAIISAALLTGAGFCVLLVVLGGLAGFLNFDSLFTWFHGLFFAAGTWEFPADSLLIELFPESFWIAAGAAWAGLVVLGGVVLGVTGWLLRANEVRPEKPLTAAPNVNSA